MEYRKTSLFEKYKIEPNVDKQKLRLLFQTDPNKRKDLPIVLKTINSDEKLYEEELFTIHKDEELSVHKKLDSIFEVINDNDSETNYKEVSNLIIKMLSDNEYYKKFYYASHLSEEKAKKIFDEYIDCIINKLEHEFISAVGIGSNESLKIIYTSICNIFSKIEKYKDYELDFDEDICDYLNNSLTLDSIGKDFITRFKSFLYLNKIVKNDYYNQSLKYIIKKMSNDLNKYDKVLIECYEDISKAFKSNELKEVSSFLNILISKNLNLRGEMKEKENKTSFETLKKLQKCCVAYDNGLGKTEKDEEYSIHESLLDFVVYSGYEWITEYAEKFKAMIEDLNSSTMYDLVETIALANPSKKVFEILSNVIINSSTFDNELNYIMKCHKDAMNHTTDKYINPFDVDDFIAKYYWLVYTVDNKLINKTLFTNIKSVGLDILSINDEILKQLNNRYLDYYTRSIYREKAINTYNVLPGNWIIEGQTVRSYINSLGSTFTGRDGEAENYIKFYDNLFRELNNRRKEQYICPNCDYPINEDDEKCSKCGCLIEWDNVENNTTDNYEVEDKETNFSSSIQSDNSGCLVFVIIAIIIFILFVIAANS